MCRTAWLFIILAASGLSLLAQACLLDNGDLLKIIPVDEELPVGTEVATLAFKYPSEIESVSTSESNSYFEFVPSNKTFVVSRRVDMDEGLASVQTMKLSCNSVSGPIVEIEVEFELQDINDFTPEFKPSSNYQFTISEAAIVGAQAGIVEAEDRDRKNSLISFSLMPSDDSDVFGLKQISNGKVGLVLERPLDYETEKKYTLVVIAKDCQSLTDCSLNQRTATAQVTVNVADADDLSPEFERLDYRASIFEDSVEGTAVIQTVAKDQDTLNAPIEYSLSGDGSEYFSINSKTGMVTVSSVDGMVKGRGYLLQVKAQQVGDDTKRATASLAITIVATNGNAPQFAEDEYTISLSESSPINKTAITLTVTDRDTNSQLEFSIIQAPKNLPFNLRAVSWNSAKLYLTSRLDYEGEQIYSFTVQVSDGEYMDRADVVINVLNENDHNPEFEQQTYKFDVKWEKNGIVGKVKAYDQDMANQTVMSYKILPPHDQLFGIDEYGEIRIIGEPVKYKELIYTVNIQASDGGRSPRTSTVAVKVTISDIPAVVTLGYASSSEPSTSGVDRLILYVVSGVVAVLLLLVIVFVIVFFRRRAQRSAKKSANQKRDAEKPMDLTYAKPFSVDSISSLSQGSYMRDTMVPIGLSLSEDQASQTTSNRNYDPNRQLGTYGYTALSEASTEDTLLNFSTATKQFATNNLSTCDQISQTEQEYAELSQHSIHSDDNNAPATIPNIFPVKSNSDSGRSSLREDRSPFMQRVPFKSFQLENTTKDDEVELSQDEDEIMYVTKPPRRDVKLVQSSSFSTPLRRPDIRNVRATEGPPIRTGSFNVGIIPEVPEGFRSNDSLKVRRQPSLVSNTSDYSSTPTQEIIYQNSAHFYDNVLMAETRFDSRMDAFEPVMKTPDVHCLASYKQQAIPDHNMPRSRSSTPDSQTSSECENTVDEDDNTSIRPEMTIYF